MVTRIGRTVLNTVDMYLLVTGCFLIVVCWFHRQYVEVRAGNSKVLDTLIFHPGDGLPSWTKNFVHLDRLSKIAWLRGVASTWGSII